MSILANKSNIILVKRSYLFGNMKVEMYIYGIPDLLE